MNDLARTSPERFFSDRFDVTPSVMERLLGSSLAGRVDDADIYLEYRVNEELVLEENVVKKASRHVSQGAGVRAQAEARTGYAHTDEISLANLEEAARQARTIADRASTSGVLAVPGRGRAHDLYTLAEAPIVTALERKLELLRKIDAAARAADPRIAQVIATLSSEEIVMLIATASGWTVGDVRPLTRLNVTAIAGRLGQQVASELVTVVDDGTIPNRRGSLNVDDEGTPTGRTVLIENGILTGYMQDRLNARLMKMTPTGNGRRESYAHPPMPRMTNTFMLAGQDDPEEILRSVSNGLYAVTFGGGQVDITSGKFVFSASEAYLIENGRVTAPVKGATLIGNGPDALVRVSRVGHDLALDEGVGTCGKDGQSVPVGVGLPTIRIDGMT